MKLTPLLLAASLVANAALLAFVATRSAPNAPAPVPPAANPANSASAREADTASAGLRAALASGDLAALQAAGLPADLARDVLLGRAFARYQQALKAARTSANPDDGRWWRTGAATRNREA